MLNTKRSRCQRPAFVHLGYAYGYGSMAKIAMRLYLATAGRSKIGFTVT
ncbi:hypothetical protein [Noviherbaspirillum sedimenti]|nr:hypothetical protein [Noviherbaspirillum sedimenti]